MDGHKLFYCGRCRGSLITVEVFVFLLDELRGNVVTDDCAACELNWLDEGELSRIGRAPEALV
jgi:Zn-finger nucleic acid-binding protein